MVKWLSPRRWSCAQFQDLTEELCNCKNFPGPRCCWPEEKKTPSHHPASLSVKRGALSIPGICMWPRFVPVASTWGRSRPHLHPPNGMREVTCVVLLLLNWGNILWKWRAEICMFIQLNCLFIFTPFFLFPSMLGPHKRYVWWPSLKQYNSTFLWGRVCHLVSSK